MFVLNQNEKFSFSSIKFHCICFGSLFRQTISCFCKAAYYLYFFILCHATFIQSHVLHVTERFSAEQVLTRGSMASWSMYLSLGVLAQSFNAFWIQWFIGLYFYPEVDYLILIYSFYHEKLCQKPPKRFSTSRIIW